MATVYSGLAALGTTALGLGGILCAAYQPCRYGINPKNWTALNPRNWVGLRKSVLIHPEAPTSPAHHHQAANQHNAEAIVDPDEVEMEPCNLPSLSHTLTLRLMPVTQLPTRTRLPTSLVYLTLAEACPTKHCSSLYELCIRQSDHLLSI